MPEQGTSSLLVHILRGLPADGQLVHIPCWPTVRHPVVIATVTVIVATETTEFAIEGAAEGQGKEAALMERRGGSHLRDHSRVG